MALPIPKYPIDNISINEWYSYDTPYNCWKTELRVAIAEEMNKAVFDALYAWGKSAGYINDSDSPKPAKVIINDPATVVFFSDNTKTVTKAKGGDEYDPLFGIMACALRKVGKNRVRIDAWEPVIDFLSSHLADAKECRVISDMLNTTADALELDGVMDAMEEYDERSTEPMKEHDVRSTEPEQVDTATVSDRISEMSLIIGDDIEKLDQRLNELERTRQTIRDLIDSGEL